MTTFPNRRAVRLLLLLAVCWLSACGAGRSVDARLPVPVPTPPAEQPAETTTTDAAVWTGADVLIADSLSLLRGIRVGLVTNHTALLADGTHLLDALVARGVRVTALFGPEHGVRGTASAGEHLTDGRDPATGLPIYSLYGATRKPTAAMLDSVDVLVYDIQDVGARFYTYISTLGLVMEAAAEHGKSVVVLDRPNPLGGDLIEGFLREPAQKSFVGQYPMPVTHGMTVGELARMINGERWMAAQPALTVVPMRGWSRSMHWPATGRTWVAPSPNLPTVETAMLYPGTCLIEALTNVSEGRGTPAPFATVGAPFIDGDRLAAELTRRRLPGVRVHAVHFTPTPNPGATSPKLNGRDCGGVRFEVTDPVAIRPVALGVHLLAALQTVAGDSIRFRRDGWLDKLSGTPRLQSALDRHTPTGQIVAMWQGEVASFESLRRKYLLYK